MAKKLEELSKEELQAELKAEKERSDRLQREKEAQEAETERRRKDDAAREARLRADADASKNSEPTEEQWLKLEEEYGTTRDNIRSQWKIAQRVNAPLAAELQIYRTKEAANDATRAAKEKIRSSDAQFPKYERFVDEYLSDVPMSEKVDSERLAKHIDRAIHFAKSKARADKSFKDEEIESTRDSVSKEEEADAKDGFGSFSFTGMPLTIDNEKLVPDDFRKRHQHPEIKGAVRMDERNRWKEGTPVKPR